jgi:hypothetical protein
MLRRKIFKRLLIGVWSLLLALAVLFAAGDTFGAGDPIAQIARPHLYSVARWEVGNFLKKWTHQFREQFPGADTEAEALVRVRRYFGLTAEINPLRFRVDQATRGFTQEPELPRLRQQLDELIDDREALEARIEETLEAMITSVLKEAGVESKFLWHRLLWPPVDFRIDIVPKTLVISRRDRIELLETKLIEPEITLEERGALEDTIDSRNLSSLVSSLAGLATYPSMLPDHFDLRNALRFAAHEWTHHYLFFHPLGRAYYRSGDLTSLNETAADLVGDEIGAAVYRRFFATTEEIEAERAPAPATSEDPDRFDFRVEMATTRVEADRLLAEGKIEQAEAYMEERRLFMAENRFFFRKLNQAFFAFNGTYAGRPGAISPIGGQIQEIRNRSANIGEFLSSVAGFSSYEDLKESYGFED